MQGPTFVMAKTLNNDQFIVVILSAEALGISSFGEAFYLGALVLSLILQNSIVLYQQRVLQTSEIDEK